MVEVVIEIGYVLFREGLNGKHLGQKDSIASHMEELEFGEQGRLRIVRSWKLKSDET